MFERPPKKRDRTEADGGTKPDALGLGLLAAGILVILVGVGLWIRSPDVEGGSGEQASAFLQDALANGEPRPEAGELPAIRVLKTATCGCCSAWVDHLRENGFEVTVEDVSPERLLAAKRELGIGRDLRSCHTAAAGGYVFEGHVPADLIHRVLEERPDIDGLAVPGMPVGSPGMEGPQEESYDVLALGPDGATEVYERR